MGYFGLNDVEEENRNTLINSIKVLYGDDVGYKIQYFMSPTGIGIKIEVIITSEKRLFLPIRKDITDYNCW